MKQPKNLKDILELQKILDEAMEKPRENGFAPRKRDEFDTRTSAVAELIELNEELEDLTHKTWKQKEFKEEKVLEELTDILFFIAQYLVNVHVNNVELKEPYISGLDKDEKIVKFSIKRTMKQLLLELIDGTSYSIVDTYCRLIYLLGYTADDICKEYYRKWKINLTRINGDWTNG